MSLIFFEYQRKAFNGPISFFAHFQRPSLAVARSPFAGRGGGLGLQCSPGGGLEFYVRARWGDEWKLRDANRQVNDEVEDPEHQAAWPESSLEARRNDINLFRLPLPLKISCPIASFPLPLLQSSVRFRPMEQPRWRRRVTRDSLVVPDGAVRCKRRKSDSLSHSRSRALRSVLFQGPTEAPR